MSRVVDVGQGVVDVCGCCFLLCVRRWVWRDTSSVVGTDWQTEWQNGGMAEWRNGGMAEWQNGGMAAEWQNDRMAGMPEWRTEWLRNGGMAEWRNGGWNDGGMAEWRNGGMAEWRPNGGMVEWQEWREWRKCLIISELRTQCSCLAAR